MRRPVTPALLLGCLNAVVAFVTLVAVEAATPDDFGWFAYAPMNEVVVRDPRFPWHYVVVPVALLLMNVVVVTAYLHRKERR